MSAPAGRRLVARPVRGAGPLALPSEFDPRRLVRRTLQVAGVLGVVLLAIALAPGLGEVRHRLSGARPGWLALAIVFEALSGISYVLMFHPVFCSRMSWRTSTEIGWSELGIGSLVPASGAAGLAFGAWILRQSGMAAERIARRSVAFFLIKSSVNFAAVAIIGTAMALGLGRHQSLWLTAVPAAGALAVMAAVLAIPRLGPGRSATEGASRWRRSVATVRRTVIEGAAEAVEILRERDRLVLIGAVGYWAWDNAVLWATFQAVGASPPLTVILMGYLIGQLGGLLPLPGGLGGIDGGLLGALVVYGAPAGATAAAVLAYRLILFWLPLLVGGAAFVSLRRALNDPDRPDLCAVPARA